MKQPKRKITPLAAHVANAEPRRVLPRGWTLGTILQWLPVASVTIGGIIWLTRLGDTNDQNARDIAELKAKESADYSEMKTNDQSIWQFVGMRKESKP